MGALYVRKDGAFGKNLDAALVEIYPANPDHIDLPASRSTYHPTAFAGVAD